MLIDIFEFFINIQLYKDIYRWFICTYFHSSRMKTNKRFEYYIEFHCEKCGRDWTKYYTCMKKF